MEGINEKENLSISGSFPLKEKAVGTPLITKPVTSVLKPMNNGSRLNQSLNSSSAKETPVSSPYKPIRLLDSAERWIERTSVVTKQDHNANLDNAKAILLEVINNLPVEHHSNPWISNLAQDSKPVEASTAQKAPFDMDELANLLGGLDLDYRATPMKSKQAPMGHIPLENKQDTCLNHVSMPTTDKKESNDMVNTLSPEDGCDESKVIKETNTLPVIDTVEQDDITFQVSSAVSNSEIFSAFHETADESQALDTDANNSDEFDPVAVTNDSDTVTKKEKSEILHHKEIKDNLKAVNTVGIEDDEYTEEMNCDKLDKVDPEYIKENKPEVADSDGATDEETTLNVKNGDHDTDFVNSEKLETPAATNEKISDQLDAADNPKDLDASIPSNLVETKNSETSDNLLTTAGTIEKPETLETVPIKHVETEKPETMDTMPSDHVEIPETLDTLPIDGVESRRPETLNTVPIDLNESEKPGTLDTVPINLNEPEKCETLETMPIDQVKTVKPQAMDAVPSDHVENPETLYTAPIILNEAEIPETLDTVPFKHVEIPETLDTVPIKHVEIPETLDTVPIKYVEIPETLDTVPIKHVEIPETLDTVPIKHVEIPETLDTVPIKYVEAKKPVTLDTVPSDHVEISETLDTVPIKHVEIPQILDTMPIKHVEISETLDTVPIKHVEISETLDTVPIKHVEISETLDTVPTNLDGTEEPEILDTVPINLDKAGKSDTFDPLEILPINGGKTEQFDAFDTLPINLDKTENPDVQDTLPVNLGKTGKLETFDTLLDTCDKAGKHGTLDTLTVGVDAAEKFEKLDTLLVTNNKAEKPEALDTLPVNVDNTAKPDSLDVLPVIFAKTEKQPNSDSLTATPKNLKALDNLFEKPKNLEALDCLFVKPGTPKNPKAFDSPFFKTGKPTNLEALNSLFVKPENPKNPEALDSLFVKPEHTKNPEALDSLFVKPKAPPKHNTSADHAGKVDNVQKTTKSGEFDSLYVALEKIDKHNLKDGVSTNVKQAESAKTAIDADSVAKTNAKVADQLLGYVKKAAEADDATQMDIQEEEFRPASEVFNDAAFFDMLEKADSSKLENAKRGSVLLKFDPLQARRESGVCKTRNQESLQKSFLQESRNYSPSDTSVCLFGTPPNVPRRRVSILNRQKAKATSVFSIEEASEVDMIFAQDDNNTVDGILQENLFPSETGQLLEIPVYTEAQIKQMKTQLTMEFQELMLKKDSDFQKRLKQQEENYERLLTEAKAEAEEERSERSKEVKRYTKENTGLQEQLSVLKALVDKHEELLKQSEAAKDSLDGHLKEVLKSSKQLEQETKTWEESFGALYNRHEKLKEALNKVEQNNQALKKALLEEQNRSKSILDSQAKMKETLQAKIDEVMAKQSTQEGEVAKLEAAIKRKAIQIQGLESALEQKKSENKELTELCDTLISKAS